MAKSMASKKRSLPVDYTQLHSLSLVVLYDTSFKKSRGKLYDVERIIERRKTRYVSFSLYYLFHELLKGHFARIGLTWVSFAGLRRVCFAALTRVYFPVLDGFILSVVFNGFSFSCLRRVYFAGLTHVYLIFPVLRRVYFVSRLQRVSFSCLTHIYFADIVFFWGHPLDYFILFAKLR